MTLPLALWAGATRLAVPALRRMLRNRAARGKEIPARLSEREGIETMARPPGRLIWLHAASLGETMSILPLLPVLAAEGHVLLTTGTVTSQTLLAARLPDMGLAAAVIQRFVPLDVPGWAARFLDHWRPDAAGFVESEIWPNLLAAAAVRKIPLMLLNARLSARSLARWRRAPCTARAVLGRFALIHPQSAADGERFARLTETRILPPGNLKLAAPALPVDPQALSQLSSQISGPAWVAASLHPGEDEMILAVHARLSEVHHSLLTIIAPRHPERGAALAEAAGGAPRRMLGQMPPKRGGVWIADTVGELGLIYRLAPLAFVGGSLVPHGGQNPAEPARLGRAVAVGPHTANFADTVTLLEQGGALAVVPDAQALGDWLDARLKDPWGTTAIGEKGAKLLEGYRALPAEVAGLLLGLARPPEG
ncbi:3-deoxy-D-manno-octulosonic acid transferase [Acidisoma sp. 7E03]